MPACVAGPGEEPGADGRPGRGKDGRPRVSALPRAGRAPASRLPAAAAGLLAVLALLAAVAGWHSAGGGGAPRAGVPAARVAAPVGGIVGAPAAGLRPAGHASATEHGWGVAVSVGGRHAVDDLAPPAALLLLPVPPPVRRRPAGGGRTGGRRGEARRGRGPPGRRRPRRRPHPEAVPTASSERSSPCPVPLRCPAV